MIHLVLRYFILCLLRACRFYCFLSKETSHLWLSTSCRPGLFGDNEQNSVHNIKKIKGNTDFVKVVFPKVDKMSLLLCWVTFPNFDPKLDPYIYQKSKIRPILRQDIFAKFVLSFEKITTHWFTKIKVWEGVIHLPEGWKWDPIPRHIPNTSFPPGIQTIDFWLLHLIEFDSCFWHQVCNNSRRTN